jgi:ribonucrease Y
MMQIFMGLSGLLVAVIAFGAGYLVREKLATLSASTMETQARRLLEDAKREADSILKEAKISAKADVLKARDDFEKSTESRRKELAQLEERIGLRETNLDRKLAMLDRKEQVLEEKISQQSAKEVQLETRLVETARKKEEAENLLQRVTGMTRDEALQLQLSQLDHELKVESGNLIRRMQEQSRETAEREARKIISLAIQRYSASHSSEIVTTTVALPSEEMKGRIIGRDGRNIRSLEAETGVSILIDDTPEAVVISGFDPVRREVARQALEQLIADGRIHPTRIEELVEKANAEVMENIRSAGEDALYEIGIGNVEPEVVKTLGRLMFRTSYSQNVLRHSIEVAQLMGLLAGELGLDVQVAKRVGIFHDIGKALDHEVEGGHALIGADLLRRCGESPEVVNAVAAHHEDIEAQSVYAVLCCAADAMSSSRVGARSETTGLYVKRLEKLEAIASGFQGVEKCFAIQAGREVRVMVEPDQITDEGAMVLARDIARKIEADLKYPGQIRVTVIRERRCIDYAR